MNYKLPKSTWYLNDIDLNSLPLDIKINDSVYNLIYGSINSHGHFRALFLINSNFYFIDDLNTS